MRKIAFFSGLLILLTFITCRKDTPRTIAENAKLKPEHCANGIQDSDEFSIDCGGSCGPCPFLASPCSPASNKVTITGVASQTYTLVTCGVDTSGNYAVTCSNGNVDIRIAFGDPKIYSSQAYTIAQAKPSGIKECSVDVTISGVLYSATYGTGGLVYVNLVNGKYVFDFCNLDTFSYITSQNKAVTGNLTCN